MTDRELLELAAKAAGQPIHDWNGECPVYYVDHWSGSPEEAPEQELRYWNPLTDDGDALRLAVKLEIDICFGANYVIADGVQQPAVNNANDPCAAVRYAIVRAAAEIGMEMP